MHERPVGDLVDAVAAAGAAPFIPLPLLPHQLSIDTSTPPPLPPTRSGATVTYRGKPGCLPCDVIGCSLQSRDLHVATGTSSQFLSGLLMAAAVGEGEGGGSVRVKSASDSVVSEP